MINNSSKSILLLVGDLNFSFQNPNSAVAIYLNTIKEYLEKSGFNVVCYPENQANLSSIPAKQKVILPFVKRIFRNILPSFYTKLLAKKKLNEVKVAENSNLFHDSTYDLVIEFLTTGSQIGANLKNKYSIPLLLIYDSPLLEQFVEIHGSAGSLNQKIAAAETSSVLNADAIIAYSNSVKEYLAQHYMRIDNIHVVPCIVWKDKIEPIAAHNELIGFVGSFLKWHRVDLLVRAFENIAVDFPNSTLVLLGNGQEWNKVNEMVQRSEFNSRIVIPGYVTEEELNKWKSEFLIGVMPGSNWYGSPLKLFEYADASIAIIAPATPTVLDLFSDEEVLFIDSKNELKSLENNLRELLTNATLRQKLVDKCKIKMKTIYSKSEQLDNFNQIIINTINRGTSK